MIRNQRADSLKLGDTVRMSHVPDMQFPSMMVVKVNPDSVEMWRPYILTPYGETDGKTTFRPSFGFEPLTFFYAGKTLFDILSRAN